MGSDATSVESAGNPVCTSVCRLAKFTAGAAAAPLHTPLMIGWIAASWASAFLPNAAVDGEASSAVFSATSWVCTRFSCGHDTAAICAGGIGCTPPVVVQPAKPSTHANSATARVASILDFMSGLLGVALVKIVVFRHRHGWQRRFQRLLANTGQNAQHRDYRRNLAYQLRRQHRLQVGARKPHHREHGEQAEHPVRVQLPPLPGVRDEVEAHAMPSANNSASAARRWIRPTSTRPAAMIHTPN